jgi:homoserine dehydrogenase
MNLGAGLSAVPAAAGVVAGPAAGRRLLLLGTGTVGTAFVHRYRRLQARGLAMLVIAHLANSRGQAWAGEDPLHALDRLKAQPGGTRANGLEPEQGDILVDATASEAVAGRHPHWLARGVHVVTANKLGRGGPLERAQAIGQALASGVAGYGDGATVGAGLPLLASLRALVAGGDRIHAVEGVLSGSLAWLFNHFDGSRPFSALVADAASAGYTEPDPRIDLSGEDVRRKLLILARSAGLALDAAQVQVQSLVPAALAGCPPGQVLAGLDALDAPLAAWWEQARAQGGCLRFVGRFDAQGAQVGLRILPAGHPLCAGTGTDNRVAIHSDRYAQQPLLIQGPGAGAEVTAAALLDDVLRLAGS